MFGRSFQLPSGYVKIAMENGSFIDVVPIKMVIFKGFLYVYQRVSPQFLASPHCFTRIHQGFFPTSFIQFLCLILQKEIGETSCCMEWVMAMVTPDG
jgi:hypothetical protein